jgi:Fur family transcriptional regulator, peroxide stress response regulator
MARKSRISAAVLALMETREHHAWTLEDLHSALAERGASGDFSSIFRAAEKLVAEGTLCKVMLDDGRARFELVAAHHDHLHCTACDQLVPVPCVIKRGAFAALEARTGVAISDHQLIFSGLCPNCRAGETGRHRRRR